MDYISQLIWYSRACSSYQDFFDRGMMLTGKLLNQGFLLVQLKSSRSPQWLGWPLWNICVTNDHGYVPPVVCTFRSFPHSWLITGFVTRWTRRVLLVELELLTFPEHLSSPPVCSGVHVTRSLVLCVCLIYRCLFFCPFLLAIVLSVLLRFMDFHYPFGIFKLFLCKIYVTPNRICLLIVDWYSLRVTSVYNSRSQCIERIWYTMLYNKNVDIKFSAHDAFLGEPSSGTSKKEILESHIIKKCWEQ